MKFQSRHLWTKNNNFQTASFWNTTDVCFSVEIFFDILKQLRFHLANDPQLFLYPYKAGSLWNRRKWSNGVKSHNLGSQLTWSFLDIMIFVSINQLWLLQNEVETKYTLGQISLVHSTKIMRSRYQRNYVWNLRFIQYVFLCWL